MTSLRNERLLIGVVFLYISRLQSELVDQVAPPTYSLFGPKSDNWPLSLCCHLKSFFSLFIWRHIVILDVYNDIVENNLGSMADILEINKIIISA